MHTKLIEEITIKKRFLSESIKYPLFFFLITLIIFYVYTLFYPIPTPVISEKFGLGADYLAIGDRTFYFHDNSFSYGYGENGELRGSFLYPLILNFLAFIVSKLGLSTVYWNTFVIVLASLCSLGSLFFIDKSTNIIFDKKTAKIACWIFVLCPYTLFYCLTGGITIYMTLGVSVFTYLISKSKVFISSEYGTEIPLTMIFLLINSLFLSSLRPTGAIFSILVICGLAINLYIKSFKNLLKLSRLDKLIIYFVFSFCLVYCFYQLKVNASYLSFTYKNLVSEGGTFFGLERQLIRDKIELILIEDNNVFKSYFYKIVWKFTDFISGLSDIRDTHTIDGFTSFFPFFSRIFVGIFILYPINILAFLGIFIYWKKIYNYGLWISIIASILCLLPSLLGVAFSRYLIMVYPPFIIVSAKVMSLIVHEFNQQMLEKDSLR